MHNIIHVLFDVLCYYKITQWMPLPAPIDVGLVVVAVVTSDAVDLATL